MSDEDDEEDNSKYQIWSHLRGSNLPVKEKIKQRSGQEVENDGNKYLIPESQEG